MLSRRDVARTAPVAQYTYLGLHQAALSGNVGLVQYALSEGQPVDALLDGISALHVAAAGGSAHVARLLIDNGADVNLGRSEGPRPPTYVRLPRNEREKPRAPLSPPLDLPLAPHAGDALLNPGSTPLHFACAHNQTAVARLLLGAGAAPHVPDKRGVTPLDLLPPVATTSSGTPPPDSLRAIIREYYENEKQKEKEFQKSQIKFYGKAAAVLGFPRSEAGAAAGTERLGGRHSVEHLRHTGHGSPKPSPLPLPTRSPKHIPAPLSPRRVGGVGSSPPHSSPAYPPPPPPPHSPASTYTFGTSTSASSAITPTPNSTTPLLTGGTGRRPSLPFLFEGGPNERTASPARPAFPATTSTPTSSSSSSRPRSADGSDVPPPPHTPPRPRTKRSLLSLFGKRGEGDDDAKEHAGQGTPNPFVNGYSPSPSSSTYSYASNPFQSPTTPGSAVQIGTTRQVPVPDGFDRDDADADVDDEEEDEEGECDEDYGVPIGGRFSEIGRDGDVDSDEGEAGDDDGEASSEGSSKGKCDGTTTPIPIPISGAGRSDATGGSPAASSIITNTTSPSAGAPGTATPTSPPIRPGILRGTSHMRHAGSRGALRFEAGDGKTCAPPLRTSPSLSQRERPSPTRTGPLREKPSASALREKSSRGSLRTGVHLTRGRGDSLDEQTGKESSDPRTRARGDSFENRTSSALRRGHSFDATRRRGNSNSSTMSGAGSADISATPPALTTDPPTPSTDTDTDTLGLGLGHGLGLDLRSVSSHAQAEALVQKAAQSILGGTLNVPWTDGSGGGNTDLGGLLAAYGETLALERRFARGEAQRYMSPVRGEFGEALDEERGKKQEGEGEEEERRRQERMMASQRTMERYARGESKEKEKGDGKKGKESRGCALERTTSLEREGGASEGKRKPRSPGMRRPHTSDSVRSTASGGTAPPRFGHSHSHSHSRAGYQAPLRVFRMDAERSDTFAGRTHTPPHNGSTDRPQAYAHIFPHARAESLDVPPSTERELEDVDEAAAWREGAREGEDTGYGRPLKRFGGGLRSLFGKGK